MDVKAYDPEKQIPSLEGKVFFITGGTAGLGETTIRALSTHNPAHIFFTGRNEEAANRVIAGVHTLAPNTPVTFLRADISSLASVQALARRFLAASPTLAVLICNAGVMALPPALSTDGYETQFATNHLGHALLVKLLLPALQATARQPAGDARIVSLSSVAHEMHPRAGIAFDSLGTRQEDLGTVAGASWARYGQSKLANMLYADELARRYPEIMSVSVHPGVVDTGMTSNASFGRKIGMKVTNFTKGRKVVTVEEGARNQIWAATCPREALTAGMYYFPVGKTGERKGKGKDVQLAGRLWEWTQKELDAYSV